MSTTAARDVLAQAQNKLTRLLLTEPRDLPAIIEAAEQVRQAERRALEAERKRHG